MDRGANIESRDSLSEQTELYGPFLEVWPELSVSGNGNAQVDSYRPRPPQVHSGKPSLVAYLEAMRCVIAFGTPGAIDTMAGYGAGDCQIEGLVVGHSVYDSMAGPRFLRHLGKRLEAHRRQYLDEPLDPDGLVCVHALGLCRLAAAVGLSSMDAPFLPVRLLEPLPRRELTSRPAPTLRSRIRNLLGVE
jgi:hypothetical protein